MKYKLKDIVTTLGDGIHGTPTFDESGEYYFFNGNNIENGNLVIKSDTKKVNFEEYKKYKKNLNNRTILVSINGTIGKVGIYNNEKCILGKSACYFNVKEEVNRDYIKFLLMNRNFQEYIKNYSTGTTIKNMSLKAMKEFEFELPIRSIQDKVAHILNSIERKIELNIHTNNNLYEIGRAYFENYLESCKEEIRIKEVANEILDYHKSKEKKVKLINSSDITENNFPEFEFVDNCNLKGHFKKRFRKYDILYSQIRPRNHHFGYVLFENTEEYIASTRLMVVRAKEEKISSSLLYYYLTSKEAIEDFTTKTETRSGTFPQGNYGDLSSFKIKYNKNQENITNVLNIVLNRIYSNQIKTKNLEKIRDALLPKLMNDEIDLDKIEI